MHHRNPRGSKIRKLRAGEFKFGQLIFRKIIEIVAIHVTFKG